MNYLKTIMILLVSFQVVMPSEKIESLEEKWGLGDFFNPTTIIMLKTLIKELYAPEQPVIPLTVQTSLDLCKEEKRFLQYRLPIVQKNLKEYFDIDCPLRIGFCCSGGGNRAMIGTLGFLTGAAKSHVLDSVLYIAGLSGSTWLLSEFSYLAVTSYKKQELADIFANIKASYATMLHDYSMLHVHGIYLPPLISFDSTDDVCIEIAKRFAYEQPMTMVNLFGALVGDYALSLMGNDRLSEQWSRIIPAIQKGKIPLPLCAAAFEMPASKYGWFEMSPLQCGSKDLGYIPVQYLGSTFRDGRLQADGLCPEYPISFFLGMHGSAFAVTIQDIAKIQKALHKKITILKENDQLFDNDKKRNILQNHLLQGLVQATIKEITMERNALAFARFPNYSCGIKDRALQNQETLGLFDAGIAFDFPLPLLLDRPERNLDVIFLYGSFPGQKSCLQALEKYCHEQGMKFPDLSMTSEDDLTADDMTILNDPADFDYDVTIPTYIYFPTNNINLYTAPYITLNFRYTAAEVAQLSNKMENIFLDNIDEVQRVLKMVAQKRYENESREF